MNRFTVYNILLIVFFFTGVWGQKSAAQENSMDIGLSFTTSITEQKYCSTHEMFIGFGVTLKNIGAKPIILDRDSKMIFEWR